MYGLTRGTTTLVAAGVAGLLIWIATQLNNDHMSGYWGRIGLVAGAGLVMALSQLIGGWTKRGMPKVSIAVLLTAFVPVAIVVLWEILAAEPSHAWVHNHVLAWTRDIQVSGLVTDLTHYIPVLAFGSGLVFGFSFDTAGPRRAAAVDGGRGVATRTSGDGRVADEPLTADRRAETTDAPAAPRGRRGDTRTREPVATTAPRDEAPPEQTRTNDRT
jgi:hypothetical protein